MAQHVPPTRRKKAKHTRRTNWNRVALLAATFVVVIGGAGLLGVHFFKQQQPAPVMAQTVSTSTPAGPNAYADVNLIGKSAIVYDLSNGQTLYSQNANAQLPLASITKLLTLYAAAQVLSPNSPVSMSPASVSLQQDAADMGFSAGETFTFESLARLTLGASSNAGAEAIAETAGNARSQDTSSLLAGAAQAVGLSETYAVNGTGLDVNAVQSGGSGSARDIAILAGALLKSDPQIVSATTQPVVSATSEQGITHAFANTDIDVTHIPNILLSKTGYTDLAGGNLVVVYDAGINHPIAVVVLGSTEDGRFTDVSQLVAATDAHFAGVMPNLSTASST